MHKVGTNSIDHKHMDYHCRHMRGHMSSHVSKVASQTTTQQGDHMPTSQIDVPLGVTCKSSRSCSSKLIASNGTNSPAVSATSAAGCTLEALLLLLGSSSCSSASGAAAAAVAAAVAGCPGGAAAARPPIAGTARHAGTAAGASASCTMLPAASILLLLLPAEELACGCPAAVLACAWMAGVELPAGLSVLGSGVELLGCGNRPVLAPLPLPLLLVLRPSLLLLLREQQYASRCCCGWKCRRRCWDGQHGPLSTAAVLRLWTGREAPAAA